MTPAQQAVVSAALSHAGDEHGPDDCARFVSQVMFETGHLSVIAGRQIWVRNIVARFPLASRITDLALAGPSDFLVFGASQHIGICSRPGWVVNTITNPDGTTTVQEDRISAVLPRFAFALRWLPSTVVPPAPPAPPPSPVVRYTVQPRETAVQIARRYGITASRLLAANGITDARTLRAGASIVIPPK